MSDLFMTFKKYSWVRAFMLFAAGIVTAVYPRFLMSAMVYVLAGYLFLNGIFYLLHYVKARCSGIGRLTLAAGCIFLLAGLLTCLYSRRLVSILPVFLGVLALLSGLAYAAAALWAVKARSILIAIAGLILTGGWLVILVTFGGLMTLSRIAAILLLLSGIYELITALNIPKRV